MVLGSALSQVRSWLSLCPHPVPLGLGAFFPLQRGTAPCPQPREEQQRMQAAPSPMPLEPKGVLTLIREARRLWISV